VVLIAITVLTYAPIRHYGFVNYDDSQYVYENPDVLGGLSWNSVRWAFTTGREANWHPLTWLSHMLDVQLFGLNAGPHHLTNLFFHLASTLLLFWALLRMTAAPVRSCVVAALFAVHPLRVESVAWVAERKDVLSTLFWMLTLCAYVLYVQHPRWSRYLAVVTVFALGLMAKPMLVTLPFVLLLLDFWPLGRVSFQTRSNLPKLIGEKVPLLILAAMSSVVTVIVQQSGGAMAGLTAVPVSYRIANAFITYFTYMRRMVWPTGLAVLYPLEKAVTDGWLLAAFALIALSILSIWAAQRRPYILVGWFWYVGTLVPVIGLIQVGRQASADRYTYVPLIGLFLIVVFGLTDALASSRSRSLALATAGGLAIAACMWVTRVQLAYWERSRALWERTLNVTTENALAHFNLGAAVENEGKIDEAIHHYSEALRIEREYADAHYNLANALMKTGKTEKAEEARSHLDEALRIKPNFAEAHNALGTYYLIQGKMDEAITQISAAVRLKPDYAVAYNNLGTAFGSRGQIEEAISQYTEAVRLDPGYADAHTNLGVLLARQGKKDDAVAHLREALRLNPENRTAQAGLVNLTSKDASPTP
jgi:tetratricopeptide (TPR) repeat protein